MVEFSDSDSMAAAVGRLISEAKGVDTPYADGLISSAPEVTGVDTSSDGSVTFDPTMLYFQAASATEEDMVVIHRR
jgi:hypothetical protein